MLLIFIRTLITFLIMFIIIRLMGKRQIGEMQPFEFVITLLIADLACIPMADTSIPITYGVTAILTLFIVHQLFALIGKQSIIFNRLISSRPSIVIDSNGINFKELKKLNIGIDELQENLRDKGFSNFDEVEYAIVETNGKFSILGKSKQNAAETSSGKSNETGDEAINSDNAQYKTPLSVCIIENGQIAKWQIDRLNIDMDFIKRVLKKDGCDNIKDILVATLDNNGKLYYQQKGKHYKVIDTQYKGAAW